MRRLFSIIPLLIALLWLAAGASLENGWASKGAAGGNPDASELESRVKGVKVHAVVYKLPRPATPVAPGLAVRMENIARVPMIPGARCLMVVRRPLRPLCFVPPAPSRTGQVVILV